MDTSKTYIKMRRAAIPDLSMGKPPSLPIKGDVAWVDYSVFIDRLGCYYYSTINLQPIGEVVNDCFQLERQDQLQEMVQGEKHSHLLAHEFSLWCHGGEEFGQIVHGFRNCDWSMEQLWLAFVMKEKYNKTWDGEKWATNSN